jgi:iron(III) transport system permease protein
MRISRLLLIVIALAVGLLILAPIGVIVFASVWSSFPGAPGHLTLGAFMQILGKSSTYREIVDTIIYGSLTSLLGTSVGIFFAWSVHRTDVPARNFLNIMAILPITLPPVVKALAMIFLFNPNIGLLNVLIGELVGTHVSIFNIFTWPGFIYATGIGMVPAAYLILSPAFSHMDPMLEEASATSGASKVHTFFRVTVPMLMPAILSTFFLGIIVNTGIIEYPLLIGQRAGVGSLVESVDAAMGGVPQFNVASSISVIFLIFAITSLSFYVYFTRRAHKYAVIGGRGYSPKITKLGRYRYVVLAIGIVIFIFDFGLTWIMMILLSLVQYYQVVRNHLLLVFTTSYYTQMFHDPIVVTSTLTSFEISFLVAVTALITSIFFVLLSFKLKIKGGRAFEVIGTLPAAYPGVVLSLAFLWVALTLPKGLYGSIWVFVVAFTVSWIIIPIRIMSSSIVQINQELEESGRVAGTGMVGTLWKVTFPLIRNAIANSFLYVFINSFRELGAALLLITGNFLPLSVLILQSYQNNPGNLGAVASLSVLMSTVTTICFIVAEKFFGPGTTFKQTRGEKAIELTEGIPVGL